MRTRGEILRAHYLGLLKKAATWSGLVALLSGVLIAAPASATGQISPRTTTLGSSTPSASTTYKFDFKVPDTTGIEAVMLQVCTSPLETTGCSTPGSADMSSATLSAQGGDFAGFAVGTGTPPAPTANTLYLFKATPVTPSTSTLQTLTLSGVHNPTTSHGIEFYTRITTYSGFNGSGGTGEIDFGATAVSTNDQVTVSANVQESLTFCVYDVSGTCAGGVTQNVKLGTGTDNVLSANAPSGGQSKMDAATNASTGYVISYLANDLTSSSDTITAAGGGSGSGTAFSAGTALFGINIASGNTISGTTSGGITGSGSGQAVNANYTNNDKVAFVPATVTPVANSNSTPTLSNTYTVSYIAQAGSTTKPGAFSTTFTYVCTGTF